MPGVAGGRAFKISIAPHGSKYKSNGFMVMNRDETILGSPYATVVVTKDGKGIMFQVND